MKSAQDAVFDALQNKSRQYYMNTIPKNNPRAMYKTLKNNQTLIFLQDQHIGNHKRHL